MNDLKLKIEYKPIDEIMPYANNAKIHGDEDIDAIMASIQEFGFNDPIGIWKGIIVEGHGRLLAAKRLGLETVPTITLDHLTDEQRRAYALAHNRTAELSGWDFRVRDDELEALGNIDMSLFGFKGIDYDPGVFDSLFTDAGETDHEPKKIQCPHCGEWFKI